ncbi:MAG: amidohydrolase [Gemmatimonadota bacterium]
MFRTSMLVAAGFLLARPVSAQSQNVAAAVDRLAPRMIEIREDIHRHPELGNHETRTAELVATELRRLGLEVRTGVAHTGVIGILRGAHPGPVVAIRADMDGLPVTELTDVPYHSVEKTTYLGREVGVSHSCGHDIHVAAELGVANILAGMKDRIRGTVVFIFQPAEEGVPPGEQGGAKMMVAEGALANPRPDMILAFHTNGAPPDAADDDEMLGKVAYTPGPAMAGATRWDARVIGRQAHGAMPQLGVDAAVTASQIVLALQTIRSRNLSPLSDNVITVGVMRGGDRNNIVPGDMELQGTIRSFDLETEETIERRMGEIFAGITASAGATFTLAFARTPVLVNDSTLSSRFRPVLERVVGKENVRIAPPLTASEDFSYFAQEVPGFYLHIGAVPAGKTSGGHHTPTFYADDQTVPMAMRVMTALVLDVVGKP